MTPGLVIFDCDGVLVDSETISVRVEARVLTELGWPHTEDEVVLKFVGRSSAAQLAELEQHFGAEKTRLFDELTTREVQAAFEAELTAVEGVQALVTGLHERGVPTCVASSGTHDRMRHTLGLTGLYDAFAGRIFSATEVVDGKPAPDLFLHSARRMGVSPDACVVVEDSVYGVRAGVDAGMVVYGYSGGLTSAEVLRSAGAIPVHSMSELAARLLHSSASTA